MASINNTILLTFKGNVGQLNMSIDSAISKLNTLVQATTAATAGAASGAVPGGGVAGMLFGGQTMGILSTGRKAIDSALNGIDRTTKRVTQSFTSLQRGIQSVGDSMRLTSQAVSTLGRVWTVLISAPLGLFLKQQATFAVEFEDSLKRVQKVTNWTTSELGDFREMLRDVAINTSTSHIELAKIAEVIGQSGITAIPVMRDMTETINMFSIATGIAADTAATDLIRIGNAFGWTEDQMSTNVKKLASTFNKLENTMAVTAKQVMTGTAEWAQQAQTLNISESTASAYTATLIAMGMSESEAGTAMKRFTAGLIQNVDAVVEAMTAIEGYGSAREVANAIDADAEKVIMDIVYAAEAGNSAALKLADSLEIGGVRGGRAIVALANNTELLEKTLANASNEWERGLSLVQEYELAMSSTKSQAALLRNNINDVGVTLGDAMLPMINQLIMILVPAIRYFNEFVKSLSDGQKRMLVLGAVAAVALGPILFLFGQLVNSVSLVFLGMGRLLLIFPQVFSGVMGVVKAVLLAGRFFLTWPGLVLAAIVGIIAILADAGVDIAQFFIDLGNKAVAWGQRLAETYASGFMRGAIMFITKALQWVANLIASFFKGASPPKVGPLSTIDKWGAKVMEAYLKGFGKADFGILSKVGRTIEQELTRGLEGKALAKALVSVAAARMDLSKLISEFNKTGKVNDKLLKNITGNLGPIADNVRSLVRHWLEYNRLQERIAQIEERRKEVKKGYLDELKAIAASNKGMKDKVLAIREAQRARDDNLRGLTEEQELLKEKASKEKEAYEYQQDMIDAMQEQDDLLQRIADTLKTVADALAGSDLGGGFGAFDLPDPGELGLTDEVNEAMDTLQQRLSDGKKMFEGLLDGWFGKPNAIDDENKARGMYSIGERIDPTIESTYDTLYMIGEKAREIYDTILTWKDAGVQFVADVRAGIEEIAAEISKVQSGAGGEKKANAFSDLFGGMKEGFIPQAIVDFWFDMIDAIKDAGKALKTLFDFVDKNTSFFSTLGKIVGFVFTALVVGVLGTITAIARLVEIWAYLMVIFGTLWRTAVDRFKQGWAGVTGFFQLGITMLGLAWDWFVQLAIVAWNNVVAVIDAITQNIQVIISTWLALLKAIWEGRWGEVKTILATAWEQIWQNITNAIDRIRDNISSYMESLKTLWSSTWGVVAEVVKTKWEEMKATIDSYVILIKRKIQEKFEEIRDKISELVEEAKTNILTRLQEAVDGIIDLKDDMVNAGREFMAGLFSGIQEKWQSIQQWIEEKWEWLSSKLSIMNDIDSPSRVQMQVGMDFMEGLQIGLRRGFVGVDNALTDAYSSIPSSIDASGASISPYLMPDNSGIREVTININDPVVRNDNDIDEIVRQVKKALTSDLRSQSAFGGYIR